MYALLSICIGACTAYDPVGLLLYTSLNCPNSDTWPATVAFLGCLLALVVMLWIAVRGDKK